MDDYLMEEGWFKNFWMRFEIKKILVRVIKMSLKKDNKKIDKKLSFFRKTIRKLVKWVQVNVIFVSSYSISVLLYPMLISIIYK